MNKTIRGLVLKSAPFKENDLLLTILTSEQGKMNVLCRGVRRSKKTVLYTQPFVYSEFDLFCGKGLAVVDGAEVCEAFYGLREDIVCLALAQYLCDVAAFAAGGRGNAAMLRLLDLPIMARLRIRCSPRFPCSLSSWAAMSLSSTSLARRRVWLSVVPAISIS